MDMLSIATDQEMQDIFNLNKNNSLLNYSKNIWTSGTQLDCNFHYNYCSTVTTFFWNDTKWNTNQPDNINELQWCVYSHFETAASYSLSAAFIDDAPCSDLNNFICQMPKVCTSVPCYDYNCTVDPTKAAQVTAMSGPDGQFSTFCGRKYFFHNDSKSQKDAYYTCCSYGMKLVSVETDAERVCIHNGFISASWAGGPIWTSGTDIGVGCVNKFGWCPAGTLFASDLQWAAGEPNGPYVENCVIMRVNIGDLSATAFNDLNCSRVMRFLCEQPD